MPDNFVPVTDAGVDIFTIGSDMINDSPIASANPVPGDTGDYKAESIEEGEYFYLVTAPGRGSVVGNLTLPNPATPNQLTEYIGNINMVPGLPVSVIVVKDKDNVAITSDIIVELERIRYEHVAAGEYASGYAVPTGTNKQIVITPADDTVYQNLKILRDITNPMSNINIILFPPVTLNITIRTGSSTGPIDMTARLYEMNGNNKVRELSRQGNIFPIHKLADGTITLRAYGPDGITTLSNNVTYPISYSNTSNTGVLIRNLVYATTPGINDQPLG
jgi:hypothetical protein